MPELPEVETVRRTLKNQILNEEIKDVDVYYDGILENITKEEFKQKLIGEVLTDILRYGKYLIFIFKNVSIISHLRMEGKFFLKPSSFPKEYHEHIIFTFKSLRTLRYHDTRKFGKMALVDTTNFEEIMKYPSLKKLGLEANDPNLSVAYLEEKLKKHQEPIKTILLNQEIICGIGNIYADEICFMCKLSPFLLCSKLTKEDLKNIIYYSKTILDEAIKLGGTTIRSYTSSLGVTGRFQINLKVHTKEGMPCPICNTTIVKTEIGARGTYYCPNCQKDLLPKVIGITGGIATGKSVVSSYLTDLGFKVVDADKIVSNLYKSKSLIKAIGDTFGCEVIKNGSVDKSMLSKLIFNDQTKRDELNKLIHPLVYSKILDQIKKEKDKIIFIDVPLLYEAGFDKLCDKVIVVKSSYEKTIERLMMRDNIDESFARIKIASQMDIDKKCLLADYIIENSSDLWYTYKQVDEILKNIL